jgi:hypothetical protein
LGAATTCEPQNRSEVIGICQTLTRGVSHCGLAIYIKTYLKAKEELWKLKYFTMQKFIIFKKSSERNPSRYHITL